MSLRPVDLQLVVQRVAEAQRARLGGEQEAEKAAVAQAVQNQAAAQRARQEVRGAPPGSEARLRDLPDRRGERRAGRGAAGERDEQEAGEASSGEGLTEDRAAVSADGAEEAGGHIDFLA